MKSSDGVNVRTPGSNTFHTSIHESRLDLVVVLGVNGNDFDVIARDLQILGVEMGKCAISAKKQECQNDINIRNLNIELLNSIGLGCDSVSPVTESQVDALCKDGHLKEAAKLLERKLSAQAKPCGLADPFTAKLIGFWKRVFEFGGWNVGYVLVLRNPNSEVESSTVGQKFDSERSVLLWSGYLATAVLNTENSLRIFVELDQLILNHARELVRIAKTLQLNPDSDAFLEKALNDPDERQSYTVNRHYILPENARVSPLIQETYDLMAKATLEDKVLSISSERIDRLKAFVENTSQPLGYIDQIERRLSVLESKSHQLHVAVESAKRWQKRSWLKRAFNTWRTPEEAASRENRLSSLEMAINRRSDFLVTGILHFDRDWYLLNYPDVMGATGTDPATHYIRNGIHEGRQAGPPLDDFSKWFITVENRIVATPRFVLPLIWCLWSIVSLLPIRKRIARKRRKRELLRWCDVYNAIIEKDSVAIMRHIATFSSRPLISVVMPVYNTPEPLLREAVESVKAQLYPAWELCIANDASTAPHVAKTLDEYAAADSRIKVIHRKENGHISAATNSAIGLATGEFVALMDHDDLLHEAALYEVALEIIAHPNADIIYSDESIIDEDGQHIGAHFKNDFNPELFLGQNMVNHLGVYRRTLVERIGGFRIGFEGSQDYDLMLRAWATSSLDRIRHIPAILYHWRREGCAQSFSEQQLDRCISAARRSIQEFLDGEGEGAIVVAAPLRSDYSRVIRKIPEPPPLVSIIVPTKNRADLLAVCARGILEETDYKNIELLIIDHESTEPLTLELFESLKMDSRVRILPFKGEFNYSAMNNMAAREAKGSLLALVNNDIQVIDSNWLTEMVSHAIRPQIGAVGAKLLYPDERVQHAGVVVGLGSFAGHAFMLQSREDSGYHAHALLTRQVSAVTGACLLLRTSVFFEVGGLNETHLKISLNDIDLCLKVQQAGYRNIFTPHAELIHHESVSRGYEDTKEKIARFRKEIQYFRNEWSGILQCDPFYNPNLTLDHSNYSPAFRSRREKPWFHQIKV